MTDDVNNSTALVPLFTPVEITTSAPVEIITKKGKGLRKENRKYQFLARFIVERIAFLYYSQSNLTRVSGFKTRQAINERFAAACNRPTTHGWWESVLLIPSGTLKAIGASEEATNEALSKYNDISFYGGKAEYCILKAIAESIAASITPWDVALRAERMNKVNQERVSKLSKARKDREQILGF